ncbi:5-oxoprolinase-like, partial [Lathamus discolor]|uniref:5-oxoprolinase-like n=1 Tax=Lathamus discolor TaxID=678569 RepID=UPI0032B773E0
DTAERCVRDMLRGFSARWGPELEATDGLDDGSRLQLRVRLQPEGSAVFDFSGTGPEVLGNWNAPRAVTLAAIIYCVRCMVGQELPLNQVRLRHPPCAPKQPRPELGVLLAPGTTGLELGGALAPAPVVGVPWGGGGDRVGLHPGPLARGAVVGGNVLTSQRVVDVIFKAFGVCAASQGCMNNVTFGTARSGYYETVAGGAGAGPGWHGRSGVHTHMTNTRITDPEILEQRYPVVLQRFGLRPGSGGAGRWRGGDGLVRELLFRERLELAVLSERRVLRPYGLRGGSPGAPGLNLLLRRDGRTINLGGKSSVSVEPGDVFRLLTPGGGGFGAPEDGAGDGAEDAAGDRDWGDTAVPPPPPTFTERGQRLRVPAGAGERLRGCPTSAAMGLPHSAQHTPWAAPQHTAHPVGCPTTHSTPRGLPHSTPRGLPHSTQHTPWAAPQHTPWAAPQHTAHPMGCPTAHSTPHELPHSTPHGQPHSTPHGQPHSTQHTPWAAPQHTPWAAPQHTAHPMGCPTAHSTPHGQPHSTQHTP